MEEASITSGYIPGAIGRIAELHGTYYARHWGFGAFFEAKVAAGLAEFIQRRNESRDGFWTAGPGDRIEAGIAIDGIRADTDGAHLRWFIVSEALHGRGIGSRLLDAALAFCRERAYRRVYLWTFEGLDGARHLYEKRGFTLVDQFRGTQWGPPVNEQRFELTLG